jgi:hypothetical protein
MMENELSTHLRVLSVASTLTMDRKNKYKAFLVNFLAVSELFFFLLAHDIALKLLTFPCF